MQAKQEFDGHSLIKPEAIAAYAMLNEGEAASDVSIRDLEPTLDGFCARFEAGEDAGALVAGIVKFLFDLKSTMPAAEWRSLAPLITAHRLQNYLLQDPFTGWSYRKPRGYSGDAGLLDFIYGHPSSFAEVEAATKLGKVIYEATRQAPAAVAVRERREILARIVDETANRIEMPEILAIAAGHLRESTLSKSAADGRLGRWVALDQDLESIAEIGRCGLDVVEPLPGSVRDVIARPWTHGTFDLVYSAGLYDYLDHRVSVKMTKKCLEMLKPGGTYLFANFAHETLNAGYMETFMRWELILRSDADMQAIVDDSIDGGDFTSNLFRGENGAVIYATITRNA